MTFPTPKPRREIVDEDDDRGSGLFFFNTWDTTTTREEHIRDMRSCAIVKIRYNVPFEVNCLIEALSRGKSKITQITPLKADCSTFSSEGEEFSLYRAMAASGVRVFTLPSATTEHTMAEFATKVLATHNSPLRMLHICGSDYSNAQIARIRDGLLSPYCGVTGLTLSNLPANEFARYSCLLDACTTPTNKISTIALERCIMTGHSLTALTSAITHPDNRVRVLVGHGCNYADSAMERALRNRRCHIKAVNLRMGEGAYKQEYHRQNMLVTNLCLLRNHFNNLPPTTFRRILQYIP